MLLAVVHIIYGLENAHVEVVSLGYLHKVLDVLWEQRAAVSAAREDILRTDSAVGTHTVTHDIDVGAYKLAQVGNLIHEAHTGSQHRGCSILYHLGGTSVGVDYATVAVQQDRAVKSSHRLTCTLGFGAYHYAVRLHEVFHCISLG